MATEKGKPNKITTTVMAVGAILMIAGAVILLGTCFWGGGSSLSPADISPSTPAVSIPASYPTVIYEVTGSAIYASVTLNNGGGGTEQYGKVAIPWSYTEHSFADNFLYISAQNEGESGWIRVSIYLNGELYKASTSSGAYVIASASGMRP